MNERSRQLIENKASTFLESNESRQVVENMSFIRLKAVNLLITLALPILADAL
ncbi:MAG TPA: hypothetical protein VGW33_04565 [Terriglobia bacterium]|nr:hypothetical protein [Terriglobia bacterium]